MKFELEWQDRTYTADLTTVTPAEWKTVKDKFRQFPSPLALVKSLSSVETLDTDAPVALLWVAKKQAGEPDPRFEVDAPWMQLFEAFQPVVEAEDEESEDPKASVE